MLGIYRRHYRLQVSFFSSPRTTVQQQCTGGHSSRRRQNISFITTVTYQVEFITGYLVNIKRRIIQTQAHSGIRGKKKKSECGWKEGAPTRRDRIQCGVNECTLRAE